MADVKPREWRKRAGAVRETHETRVHEVRVEAMPASVAERLAAIERRLTAIEQRPVPTVAPAQPAGEAMPRFLRNAAAPIPVAAAPTAEQTADDAIAAMNDIETRLMHSMHELARRVDDMSARMDLPPLEIGPADYRQEVGRIGNWLKSIDERMQEQQPVASPVAVDPPEPVPLLPADRIRDAARAHRARLMGAGADERDRSHRLASLGHNAVSGRTAAINALRPLTQVLGADFGDLAKTYIDSHDRLDMVMVATTAIEIEAILRLQSTSGAEADEIAAQAIEAISRVTT
jgi:hypothetical protein